MPPIWTTFALVITLLVGAALCLGQGHPLSSAIAGAVGLALILIWETLRRGGPVPEQPSVWNGVTEVIKAIAAARPKNGGQGP